VSESTPRGRGRTLVLVVCAVVVALLYGAVLSTAWRDRAKTSDVLAQEQRGIAFLHPLTTLLGQLVQAESAAVHGTAVDVQQLRKSSTALGTANSKYGEALGTAQRGRDLSNKIEAALATGASTPRDQFETWTDVVALGVDLVHAVGDSSGLSRDQYTDSFYLAQAVLVQLPDMMVQSGRAADLATLAGAQKLEGDDAVRAAVARYAVAADGEAATVGLNKSISATESSSLGSDIALQLDAFRAAVATFTPPTALAQSAPVDAAVLAKNSVAVFESALPLTHGLLTQLSRLLTARAATIDSDQRTDLGATAGVVAAYLIGLLALVLRRPRRPRRPNAAAPVSPAVPAQGRGDRPGSPAGAERDRQSTLTGYAPSSHRGAN